MDVGSAAQIVRTISPPTPAPSPRPDRSNGTLPPISAAEDELDSLGIVGGIGGSTSTSGASSSYASMSGGVPLAVSASSSGGGGGNGLSSGIPYGTADIVKGIATQYRALGAHARLEVLRLLVAQSSVQELAHLSRLVAPRLRIDFLAALPVEVALHVLRFVDDPRTLARAARVSRFWRSLVNDESTWMAMCVKHRYRTRERQQLQQRLRQEGSFGVGAPHAWSASAGDGPWTPQMGSKGKARMAEELDELREEREEASILPSLYERYRAGA